MLFVDRAELEERGIAVANGAWIGGVEKRECLDIAEAERLHLQNDAGEVRPPNFGRGERRARRKILLPVEPDADARARASAASGALIGRSLRDPLDGETLHLAAHVVTADPRETRIDHVANTRH